MGQIAHDIWMEIPLHFRNVMLDEMVVMPNHIHGIIMITDTRAGHALPLQENRSFGDVPTRSLHTIVGSYKSAVTKLINRIQGKTDSSISQRNYYEHIVRNGTELNRIREYVRTNPIEWDLDRENPRNRSTSTFDELL